MVYLNMVANNFTSPLAVVANARNNILSTLPILNFLELDFTVDSYVLPAVSHLLLNVPQTLLNFLLMLLHPGYGALCDLHLTRQLLNFLILLLDLFIFQMVIGDLLMFQMVVGEVLLLNLVFHLAELGLTFIISCLKFAQICVDILDPLLRRMLWRFLLLLSCETWLSLMHGALIQNVLSIRRIGTHGAWSVLLSMLLYRRIQ